MACADPGTITGGTFSTNGPYADGSVAVITCNSGYVMSGSGFITCSSGVWSTAPQCVQSSSNTVTVNDSTSYNFPDWLVYFIAVLCGIIALAIITCLLVCCLQLFGCYKAGGMFGEPNYRCTCCCGRNNERYERRCTIIPRKYEYDEDGRRFHYDDLGRRCYYPHRNRYIKSTTAITPESESKVHPNGKSSVVTVSEVQVDKKKFPVPAKELNMWMPHAHPVRNINTSTK